MPLDISATALSGDITRSLAEKMYSAQFKFPQNLMSKIGSSYYWNPIIFFQPDYLGNQNPVFLGFFPSANENLTAVGPEDETLTAYDYSWYLTMQYLPDNMVVMPYTPGASPGVMTPDVFILGCLGETLALNNSTFLYYPTDTNWNLTTKINPYAINVPPWSGSSAPVASQQTFTTKTTKAQAIDTICQMLGWIFYVRWLSLSGVWNPCAWFVDQDNIDLPTASGGLGLPATVNLTNPATASTPPASSDLCWFLSAPATMSCQGDDQYNIAIVRYKATSSASWSQGAAWYGNVYHPVLNPTGTVPRIEYVEESTTITTMADANARAAAILQYYGSSIVTWKMTFNLRSDLQLLQKIHISGYSAAAQNGIPDGDYRIIDIENNLDQGASVNSVTVSIISNTNFQAYLGLNKVFINQVYEIQNIVQSVNDTTTATMVGTVISRTGTVLLATVVQHDSTSVIYQATDPTNSINTGMVTLTPDGSGNLIATQGIAIGTAAADVNAGSVTVNGGKITANTLNCSAIMTSTLNAVTISLGTTGSNGIIMSSNFSSGSAGFQISGDGSAEFNNVTVRGTIATATISSGGILTVSGDIRSANYVQGSAGWKLFGDGICEFWAVSAGDSIVCSNGSITGYQLISHTVLLLDSNIADGNANTRTLYTNNGTNLLWKSSNGTVRTILP